MIQLTEVSSQSITPDDEYPVTRYDIQTRLVFSLSQNRIALGLLGLLLGASVLVAFLTRNTYDTGDSIQHYLIARFVPQHPLNLLNAWAKPLFTLVAAGPAQGDFLGMKLLQCGIVALSAWLAYGIARRLRLPWPALVILFCYAAPDYFRIQFSGLTEPLFGLLLVGAVALAVADPAHCFHHSAIVAALCAVGGRAAVRLVGGVSGLEPQLAGLALADAGLRGV